MKRDALRIAMLLCLTGLAPAGCNHTSSTTSATLPQRGYLWQRDWTPAVLASLTEANKRMDGVIVLGAEIIWNGSKSNVVSSSINWQSLKERRMPSVALRVASHPKPDGTSIPVILSAAKSLCDQVSAHGLRLTEFQLDYDCPQKDLSSYRAWLPQVREVVRPIPFTITSLPAWLDEPEFDGLIQEVDGYVLQVHSVPTSSVAANATLCDTQLARQWIAKAATHRKTFAVALPSYRCSAGYATSLAARYACSGIGNRCGCCGGTGGRTEKESARKLAGASLVPIAGPDRRTQLALADHGSGDGGPETETSTQRPAGRREPDRSVNRECGRSGRANALEYNCEMERDRIGSVRRAFRVERPIGRWSRRF